MKDFCNFKKQLFRSSRSVIWVGTDLPAPILLPLLPPFSPSGSTFRDDSELIESGKGAGSVGQKQLLGQWCWCLVTMGEAG